MRPLELTLRNFLVWTDVTIDLRRIYCAVISGPNGSGKSAIFDGILVALFGRATKAGVKGMDEYITVGKTEYQVEFIFEVEGKTYRIVRSRGRDKSVLDLFESKGTEGMFHQWDPRSGNTPTETQAKIEALIRMDYKTFTASSIVLQGQADAFTRGMEDADRRLVLARILGLDLYEELVKQAKAELKVKTPAVENLLARMRELEARESAEAVEALFQEARRNLAVASGQLLDAEREYTQAQLRSVQVPLLKKQAEEMEAQIGGQDGESKKAAVEIAEAQARIERLAGILKRKDEVAAAEEEANLLRPMLAELDDGAQEQGRLSRRITEVTRTVSAWQVQHATALTTAQLAVSNAEKLAAEIDTVPCAGCGLRDEGPCQETCKYLKDACAAQAQLPTLRASLEELGGRECPAAPELETLQKALSELGYDSEAHVETRKSMAALEPLLKLKPELAGAEAEADAARATVEEAQKRKDKISDDVGLARLKLRQTKDRLAELAPVMEEVDAKRQAVASAKAIEASARSDAARLEQRLADAKKTEADRQGAEGRLEEARQEVQALELVAQAFGPKGIPAAITKNVVPEIEALANKMMERLSRGRFQVEVKMEREGKSTGTEQEVLKIVVYDRGVERGYTTYSGAEKFMIDISLRCAISHFLANRAGAEIRMFILDEGLSACDPGNREAMLGTLMEISRDFGLLLVITHLDEIKDAFPQRIEVRPGSEGSTLEVVAGD